MKAGTAQHRLRAGCVRNPPVGGIAGEAMLNELHAWCSSLEEDLSLSEWIVLRNGGGGSWAATLQRLAN
jgi:hypothetical protein